MQKFAFKWKYLWNEFKLIFKSLPYNAIIDEFVEQYERESKKDQKNAECNFLNNLNAYAKEIRLPTYHLGHMKQSDKERMGNLVREIREYSANRFSHFITMIAIIIALLSLIIAIISIAR